MRHDRFLYIAILALVCLAFVLHTMNVPVPTYGTDDAYITIHNAQVLRSGQDPNYQGTPALVGATSILHTLSVAGLMTFFDPLRAMDVSLWIAVVIYALGLTFLARTLRANIPETIGIVIIGILAARIPHQLMNGLETGLAMAGVTWALALALQPSPSRWLPVVCGVLPAVRPELLVLSILLVGHHLQRTREKAFQELGLFVVALLPWVLIYYFNTGELLPTTMEAKRAFFAESGGPAYLRWRVVSGEMQTFAMSAGLLTLGVIPLLWSAVGRLAIAFIAIFLFAYFLVLPGALGHYEQRYMYVFVPPLLMGLAMVVGSVRQQGLRLSVLALMSIPAVYFAPTRWHDHMRWHDFNRGDLQPLASWCLKNIPPGSTVLVHDAGYLSFATDLQLADMVGLKTPSSIPYHERYTLPTYGINRPIAISEIARDNNAKFLIVFEGWDRIYRITPWLKGLGWKLELLRAGKYRTYRLTAPEKTLQLWTTPA